MIRTAPPVHSSRKAQSLIWLLLLGVLWLQCVGVMHRLAHAPAHPQTLSQAPVAHLEGSQVASANADGAVINAAARVAPGHGEGVAACQLFDVACSGVALSLALPSLAVFVLPKRQPAPKTSGWRAAAFFNLYEARAPPALI